MTRLLLASATTLALLGGSQVPAQSADSGLASIASEIRLLRASIDRANEGQIQIQAISVYLTNEQGRLVQLGNRLDAIRHDLDIAAAASREASAAVTSTEAQLADAQLSPPVREQFERVLKSGQQVAALKADTEAQLRLREQQAQQEFQTERDQYTAMIARLQQFIK